jgi:hypothetical protein
MFRQLFEYIKTIIYGTQYKNEDYAQDSELQYQPPAVDNILINIYDNNAANNEDEHDGPIWF